MCKNCIWAKKENEKLRCNCPHSDEFMNYVDEMMTCSKMACIKQKERESTGN